MKRIIQRVWLMLMPVVLVACSIANLNQATPTAAFTKTPPATPTAAVTPTRTVAPTATSDPLKTALDAAKALRSAGKDQEAAAQYLALIQQYPAATPTLDLAYTNLIQIAANLIQQADAIRKKDTSRIMPPDACPVYKKGADIYSAILNKPEKPKMDLAQFYQDSAQVNNRMIECDQYVEKPSRTYAQIVEMLMTQATLYPDNAGVESIFIAAIMQNFSRMVSDDYATQPEAVTKMADRIVAKYGDKPYGNQKVAKVVNDAVLKKMVCSGKAVPSPLVASAANKRAYDCTNYLGSKLESAGVLAQNSGEIWYTLNHEYKDIGSPLQCTEAGGSFTYSYRAAFQEIYTLRDVRSGVVKATTVFTSTQPRCVFSTCSVNRASKTATCNGGEAKSGADDNVLTQWLTANVR